MPILETEDGFELQVDLGEFGGLLEFRKPEDAEAWIKKEIQFWDWTETAETRNIQELTQTRSTISGTLNNINEHIKHWRGSAPETARNYVEQLESLFAGFQKNRDRTGLLSRMPEAIAVDLVRKESDDFNGLVALAYSMNRIKTVLQNPNYLPGFVLYIQFRYGLTKSAIAAHKRELASKLKDIESILEKLNERSTRQEEEYQAHEERLHQLNEAAEKSISEFQKSSGEAFKEIEDTYRNATALQAPVTYWTDKRTKHSRGAVAASVAFLVYVIFAYYVGGAAFNSFEFADATKWKSNPFGLAALLAVTIGILTAGARIFYRQFVSQLHLYNDADERRTMVNAYLALSSQGHAKEEFMAALIERLFAPVSDGLVKDDIGPITVIESARSMIDKARSAN